MYMLLVIEYFINCNIYTSKDSEIRCDLQRAYKTTTGLVYFAKEAQNSLIYGVTLNAS